MWWKGGIPRHLPLSEGPYVPGCLDLMTDYSPEGCFLRLYYPTSLSHIKTHSSHWIPWLPNGKYLDALAYVLHLWRIVLKLLYMLYAGNMHIPIVWGADLRSTGKNIPVVVFSHGLGGTRFFYSCICTELASHGFLVAAVEHRDNSACTSFFYKSAEHKNKNNPTWIRYKRVPLGPGHYPTRKRQVDHRALECQKVVDLLERLNDGCYEENILGGEFLLSQLKGRLDLSNLVMMGHSFGGATALRVLGNDSRLRAGVILDGWMFPVKEDTDLLQKVHQPLLFVNTQTFPIASNTIIMKKFTENVSEKCGERATFTIRATTHENQSDSPYLLGYWLDWFMKKLNPAMASKINHHLILNFLQKHVGVPSGTVNDKYLQSQAHNVVLSLSI